MALVSKNPPANTGDLRDVGSIPGSRRSPGGRHGKRLHYSCLWNPMDREAWWSTVHRVTMSQTWLKWLSMHVRRLYFSFVCKKNISVKPFRIVSLPTSKVWVIELPVTSNIYWDIYWVPIVSWRSVSIC